MRNLHSNNDVQVCLLCSYHNDERCCSTVQLSPIDCCFVIFFRYYPKGLIDPSVPLGQWRIIDVWNATNTEMGVIQLEGNPEGQKRAVVAKNRICLIFLAIR